MVQQEIPAENHVSSNPTVQVKIGKCKFKLTEAEYHTALCAHFNDAYFVIFKGNEFYDTRTVYDTSRELKEFEFIENQTMSVDAFSFEQLHTSIDYCGKQIPITTSIMKYLIPKQTVSQEYMILAKQMIYDTAIMQEIFNLRKNHGDKYCCINRNKEYSLNTGVHGTLKYSVFVEIACKDSELYNFWVKGISENLRGFQDLEIVTVDEFCDIYLNHILLAHINFCKSF